MPTRKGLTVDLAVRQLSEALRSREDEIEQAVRARILALDAAAGPADPLYLEGLFAAVSATLDHLLRGLERPGDLPPKIPSALLAQARRAAQFNVPLELTLRRYTAGQAILSEFLVGECQASSSKSDDLLHDGIRTLAFLSDRLLTAIAEEFRSELGSRVRTSDGRLVAAVERILAGERPRRVDLDYDLGGYHLGIVARGIDLRRSIRKLAADLDRRLLFVPAPGQTVWAWLGGRRSFEVREIESVRRRRWPAAAALAIGEPGKGIDDWRLTHRQARAALPVAVGRSCTVCYGDVAMLVAAVNDELLSTSLGRMYLHPLRSDRDGGIEARRTLRAYFAADGNTSSAAAMLRVKRHTVTNRLRSIEERIGRPLSECLPEMITALRMAEHEGV